MPMAAAPAKGPAAAGPAFEGDPATPEEGEKAPPPKFSPPGIAITAEGGMLVGVGERPNEVDLHDIATNRIVKQIPKQPAPITAVAYDPRSLWGATGGAAGEVQLWSLARPKVGLDEFAAEATSGMAFDPLLAHSGPVTALAIDGAGGKLASVGQDGALRLWRLARPRVASSLDSQGGATVAAMTPDRKRLFVGDPTGQVGIWDVEKLALVGKLDGGRDAVTSLLLSQDGQWLVMGDRGGSLHVWEVASKKRIASIPGHREAVVGLALGAEGRELYSVSRDDLLRAWSFPLGTLTRTARVELGGGMAVGGSQFVTIVRPEKISVLDATTGKEVQTLPGLGGRPNLTAASLRGDIVAATSWEGTAFLANATQGRVLAEIHRNGRAYKQLSLSPEGDAMLLVPADAAPTLLRFSPQAASGPKIPASRLLATVPGQETVIAATNDGKLTEWSAISGASVASGLSSGAERPPVSIGAFPETIRFLACSPTGEQVVAAGGSTVARWARQGAGWAEASTTTLKSPVECLSWTSDGQAVAIGLEDGTLQVLAAESKITDIPLAAEAARSQRGRIAAIAANQLVISDGGPAEEPIPSRSEKFTAVAVSPRDGTVAVAEANGTVRLIRKGTAPEMSLEALSGKAISALRYSPDGERLAAGTATGDIAVWNIPREASPAVALPETPHAGAISPDGRLVAAALENGDIRVMDRETGAKVREWKNPVGQPVAAAWSRDGALLAVAGHAGVAEVWNVASGASVDRQTEGVGPRLAMAVTRQGAAIEIVSILKDGRLETWQPGLKTPERVALDVRDLKSASLSRDAAHGLLTSASGETVLMSRAGKEVKLADVCEGAGASTISPEGTSIAWVEEKRRVQIVELRDQAARKSIELPDDIDGLRFCDEHRLAVLAKGEATIWSHGEAGAGAGAKLETLRAAAGSIEELFDGSSAPGAGKNLFVRTGAGAELLGVHARLFATGNGKRISDLAVVAGRAGGAGRVVACREAESLRTIDIGTWRDADELPPPGHFDAIAATTAGDLLLGGPEGVKRWRGATGQVEAVEIPEKFSRIQFAEMGRDTIALADAATYRIPPQGPAERMGAGNALAVVNGRLLLRSGDRLAVEAGVPRDAVIPAGKPRWAALCWGGPGVLFGLTKTGAIVRVQLAEKSLTEEGTIGTLPIAAVRDPEKPVLWIAAKSGELWQWDIERKQASKWQTLPDEILSLALDPERKRLVAGTASGVALAPLSGEMFVKVPAAGPVASLALVSDPQRVWTVSITPPGGGAQKDNRVERLSIPQMVDPHIPLQELTTVALLDRSRVAWCGKGSEGGKVHVVATGPQADDRRPQAGDTVFAGARGTIIGLFTTAEDRFYALGSSGEVSEWDLRDPAAPVRFWTLDRRFKKFLVQPAARRLALVSAAGGGAVIDLAARVVLDQLPAGDQQVDPIAFPEGTRLTVLAGDFLGALPVNSLRAADFPGQGIADAVRLAGASDLFFATAGNPPGVSRCDAATGKLATALELKDPAQRIVPLEDDSGRALIVSGRGRATLTLAHPPSGKVFWQRAIEGEVACAWAGPAQILIGTKAGGVYVLSSATGDLSQAFPSEPARAVFGLSKDGGGGNGNGTFLVVTEGGRLMTLETSALRSIQAAEGAVTAVALDPSGAFAATGDETGQVVLWKLEDGSAVARCHGLAAADKAGDKAAEEEGGSAGGAISSLALSADAKRLTAASLGGKVALWDLSAAKQPGEPLPPMRTFAHPAPVRAAAMWPGAERIVTASDDKLLRTWDAASGFEIEQYIGHETPPLALCLVEAGQTILSYDAGGSLRKWSGAKGVAAKVQAAAKPEGGDPDAPPAETAAIPAPPPAKVETAETVAIAVKTAERLDVARREGEGTARPISLLVGGEAGAPRPRAPEATMRNAIGAQLEETVGALRTETNDRRKDELRQTASSLLDRLNTLKPRSSSSDFPEEPDEQAMQAQAEGEGSGASLPTELVVGKERFPAPLTAQQVVAIKTTYNFVPGRFSPVKICIPSDGKTILAMQPAAPGLAADLTQGVVEAWDVATRLRLRRWTQVSAFTTQFVGLTADDSTLYTLPDLFAFGMASGEHREIATGVRFASVNTSAASLACIALPGRPGETSEILQLLNGKTLTRLNPTLTAFEAYVTAMAFAPDASRLIVSIRERQRHRLVELNPQTFQEVALLETVPYTTPWTSEDHRLGISRILFLDQGQKFVTYGEKKDGAYQFVVWEGRKALSTRESKEPLISEDFVRASWPIAGTTRVAFRLGPKIHVIDHKKLSEEFQIDLAEVHFGTPSVAISGDGAWFASGDDGGNVAMWHLPTGAGPMLFRPQLGPIVGLDFSQSGRYLATLGEENMLRMWKLGLPDSRVMEAYYQTHKSRLIRLRRPKAPMTE